VPTCSLELGISAIRKAKHRLRAAAILLLPQREVVYTQSCVTFEDVLRHRISGSYIKWH